MSIEGRTVVPPAIRARRKWEAATRLEWEDTPEGVLVRQVPLFPPSRLEDVLGALKYDGPTVSIEEMDAAVLAEAAKRL
jgi:bifunctional DNA-binding transcriptional regulator/antitoxin component of YhaV-PrlF toxin-antitoxin module